MTNISLNNRVFGIIFIILIAFMIKAYTCQDVSNQSELHPIESNANDTKDSDFNEDETDAKNIVSFVNIKQDSKTDTNNFSNDYLECNLRNIDDKKPTDIRSLRRTNRSERRRNNASSEEIEGKKVKNTYVSDPSDSFHYPPVIRDSLNENSIPINNYSMNNNPSNLLETRNRAIETQNYEHSKNSNEIISFENEKPKIADIPSEFLPYVSNDLYDFTGSWQIIYPRSESIDDLLKELGYSAFKRQTMVNYKSISDIYVTTGNNSAPTISIVTHFPLKITKKISQKYDCKYNTYKDDETGIWKIKSCIIDGRPIQQREGSAGVMYDVRVVFKADPYGEYSGPIQLFTWVYFPNNGPPIIVRRWLRKI